MATVKKIRILASGKTRVVADDFCAYISGLEQEGKAIIENKGLPSYRSDFSSQIKRVDFLVVLVSNDLVDSHYDFIQAIGRLHKIHGTVVVPYYLEKIKKRLSPQFQNIPMLNTLSEWGDDLLSYGDYRGMLPKNADKFLKIFLQQGGCVAAASTNKDPMSVITDPNQVFVKVTDDDPCGIIFINESVKAINEELAFESLSESFDADLESLTSGVFAYMVAHLQNPETHDIDLSIASKLKKDYQSMYCAYTNVKRGIAKGGDLSVRWKVLKSSFRSKDKSFKEKKETLSKILKDLSLQKEDESIKSLCKRAKKAKDISVLAAIAKEANTHFITP